MRYLLLLPALAFALIHAAGCGSTTSAGAGGGATTGTTTGTDPCAGLGCASLPGRLTLEVVDGSNQPVQGPVFTEKGQALGGVCETDAGVILPDAGSCGSWIFDELPEGPHTIQVSAPGYAPATVSVTIQGPTGCCGMGPAVDRTVVMQPSPADAGTD